MVQAAEAEAAKFSAFVKSATDDPEVAKLDLWQSTIKEVLSNATRIYLVKPDQPPYMTIEKPERIVPPPSSGGMPSP